MSSPDLAPEQGFPRSLGEVKRPSDEEVEGIPGLMREQIAEARRARSGKISPSDPEMLITVVGPTPDQDFLRTFVRSRLREPKDCQVIAQEASARLEQVSIAAGITERPLREFLEGVRRIDDSWPGRIVLFGMPAVLRSEQPTLSFRFPVPEVPDRLDIKGPGFALEEIDDLMNRLGHKLVPEGIYPFYSFVPDDELFQAALEGFQRNQRSGNVLAFAIAR